MSPKKEQHNGNQESQISKFYDGKSLLITGAAGFLGVVLLEILLRCCPGIRRIYILLRPKKGVLPEDRKKVIFKKPIFHKIREKDPDAIDKVTVIAGDVSQKNLGMNDDDFLNVSQAVNVVFHCAAVINFLRPLRYMLQQNFAGADNVIEFCRKLQKLDVLVYTSTAFSNSNRNERVHEKIYKMPFTAEHALQVLRKGNDEDLDNLFNMFKPKFPNNYTFSKCLAENLLAEKASDLPITIVRPSIILWCWKGVLPGYIEGTSGFLNLVVGIGKGFVRVLRVVEDYVIDYIPVDVVANTHVAAACFQATQSLPSPTIYNCASSDVEPLTWRELVKPMIELSQKHPVPNSYQRPSITLCKGPVKYWTLSILDHYIPAIGIDTLLWITGRKPRLFTLYKFFDKTMGTLNYFMLRQWIFSSENFKSLSEKLNNIDSEIFPVDIRGYTFENSVKDLPTGAPAYQWENDKKSYDERMRTTYIRYCLTSFIKWSVLGSMALLLFVIVF